MDKLLDVLAIGNAIVDILAYIDDDFLQKEGMHKDSMQLIDEKRAAYLYDKLGAAMECSGGSAANTQAGIAMLGGKAAFIGKVFDDQLGHIFRHDMKAVGVRFDTPAATTGKPTAASYICVTEDAKRTMNTYLGASTTISKADVDELLVAAARILYIEGYMWDDTSSKEAILHACALARQHGTQVALSLSDPFCVERHHAELMQLVREHVDILFANEAEIKALTEEKELEAALAKARHMADIAAITLGKEGSVILRGEERVRVAAETAGDVVDSTGAGDLYAAGVLYGLARDWPLKPCATLGSRCAGMIISQLGARSQKPLKPLLENL